MLGQTIGGYFHKIAGMYPERDAVAWKGRHISFSELDCETDVLARGLYAFGIRQGTHVAVWANNHPHTLMCFLAIWKLGAVLIPLCTGCTEAELQTYLEVSDAEFLFYDTGFKDMDFASAVSRQTVVPESGQIAIFDPSGAESGFERLLRMGAEHPELEPAQPSPDCWDSFLFTSGSTGRPHAVVTTQEMRVANSLEQGAAVDAVPGDRYCVVLPLYHCFAISGLTLAALLSGGCVCFPEDRHTVSILRCISEEHCTVFSAVPTLFSAILARKDLGEYDLSSLRTGMIGGSSYPPELFLKICSVLGMTLIPSLGQTECTAGLTTGKCTDSPKLRSTTLGKFFAGIEGMICSEKTGVPCAPGEMGEICIRGYSVMKGYYEKGVLHRENIDEEGWLHTGDLGAMDEQGYITYGGRLKELINRGGERVSPGEIETLISRMPEIRSVKVTAVPDAHYMEEICACVVANPGFMLTEELVREYCKEHTAYYKVPRYVLLMDELPLLSNGKPDGKRIKQYAIKTLNLGE